MTNQKTAVTKCLSRYILPGYRATCKLPVMMVVRVFIMATVSVYKVYPQTAPHLLTTYQVRYSITRSRVYQLL